jgi:hypothetical protein
MKNLHVAWSILLLLAIISGRAWCEEKVAIAALKKSGHRFVRDENRPGKPVIELTIVDCFPEKELLRELPALKQLQSLTIITAFENVDAALKGLNEMKKLQYLNIRQCELTDFTVKQIAMATGLRTLDIRFTGMTDAELKQLGGLKQLRTLYLGDEGVTDISVKELARLTKLQTLDLRGTKVTKAGVAALKRALPECKILDGFSD